MELGQWIEEELKENQEDNSGLEETEALLISDDDLREVLRLAKKTADPFAVSNLGENAVLLPPSAPSGEDADEHDHCNIGNEGIEASKTGSDEDIEKQSSDSNVSPNLVKQASEALEAFKNEAENYMNNTVLEFQCNIPEIFEYRPEFWLGRGVDMVGPCRVHKLIHLDGPFKGTLQCVNNKISSVRIGAMGVVRGNIKNAYAVLVYGKVIGNVESEHVILLDDGGIHGDVVCKSIFVSNNAEVVGNVNIHRRAPFEIDTNFRVQGVTDNIERFRISNKDGSFPGPPIDPMLLETPLPDDMIDADTNRSTENI